MSSGDVPDFKKKKKKEEKKRCYRSKRAHV